MIIDKIALSNFGPISTRISWEELGAINLIIGKNAVGKSFLLKSIYTAIRTIEEFGRGNDPRTASEILQDKLYWTFQSDRIGDLVSKGSNEPLTFSMSSTSTTFSYSFGRDTQKKINTLSSSFLSREDNSIYLPAKEVLSLYSVILKSRLIDKSFGFDDTYLDLVQALQQPASKGKNHKEFADSRRSLEGIIGGKVVYDSEQNHWVFQVGNARYPIGATAEGVKKIAILDTLLGNRYLSRNSGLFIDEPEAALHPSAISQLMEIIYLLSKSGMQIFIASHSYFVIKKLFIIAQREQLSIPVLNILTNNQYKYANLLDEMPDNPIVEESIQLYKEEINLAYGEDND